MGVRGVVAGAVAAAVCGLLGACASADTAAAPPSSGPEPTEAPRANLDGSLRIGVLLPQGGLGAAGAKAVTMAVSEMNAAGGVLNRPVQVVSSGLQGSDPKEVRAAAQRLIETERVDAVIGPSTSKAALSVIGVFRDQQVVACSPTATAAILSEFPDDGYFIRTAPSDRLQAKALSSLIGQRVDIRPRSAVVLYPDDDYGRPFSLGFDDYLSSEPLRVTRVPYDALGEDLDGAVEQAFANGPVGAVVLIGLSDPGAQLLRKVLDRPDHPPVFLTDGMATDDLAAKVGAPPGALEGIEGTVPVADPIAPRSVDTFGAAYAAADPVDPPPDFARYSYDCTMLIGIAAVAAGEDDPVVFKDELEAISRGFTSGAASCRTFVACRDLALEGRDLNYSGALPDVDLNANGDAFLGSFHTVQYNADGIRDFGDFSYPRLP